MTRQSLAAVRRGEAAIVGRDEVLARLRRAVDEAVAGRGLTVLLTGEAGIGKTALLRAAARYAEGTGARPAWGWGWPGEGTPGYWPWIQVLRALGLDARLPAGAQQTAASDAPASARFQLFDDVTSLLLAESRIQPVAVLLDDLHAADEPSLLLLDFLARRLPAGAVSVTFAAQLVAGLGAGSAAGQLYQVLLPFAGQAVVSGAAISFRGSVAHYLGMLAAALGRGDEAAAHLEQAAGAHERLGAVPWALRSRYELARLRLADPRQRDAAAAELADVGREAEKLGMAGLAHDAQAHAGRAGLGPARPVLTGVFRREGALWTLSYGGVTVRMRDAKGLADLAPLLAAPGREISAVDLVAASSGGLGRADLRLGSDEVLDETARRQVRQRLADLDEEIAEADAWADPERASRARAERDALVSEITGATGLAGRARRLGDQPERARKAVTARIRDMIGRIERVHPSPGAHLRATVTTGTRCGYSPPAPTSWRI